MKTNRQAMIIAIIKDQVIGTQEDLGEALKNKGVLVTQATLSRDIKELGLIKVPAVEGYYRYSLPQDRTPGDLVRRAQRMLEDAVVSMDAAENIIVVKTMNGTAQGVAAAFDDLEWPEVLGTVAGDDTMLVVIRSKELVEEVLNRLHQLRR
ncbi:MAG TPA: arginine repressor [Firmicutes bacterium]|jgi:transcriptional regulator of arginine metabolism|nr:arginine repressor [Bacillota bacterium]